MPAMLVLTSEMTRYGLCPVGCKILLSQPVSHTSEARIDSVASVGLHKTKNVTRCLVMCYGDSGSDI